MGVKVTSAGFVIRDDDDNTILGINPNGAGEYDLDINYYNWSPSELRDLYNGLSAVIDQIDPPPAKTVKKTTTKTKGVR